MRIVAIARTDGGVSIMNIFDEDVTIENEIRKWIASSPDLYVTHRSIDPAELPSEEFTKAWILTDAGIVEDLERARQVKLEQLRNERKLLFEKSDNEIMRAMVNGDQMAIEQLRVSARALQNATEPVKDPNISSVDQLRGLNISKAIDRQLKFDLQKRIRQIEIK